MSTRRGFLKSCRIRSARSSFRRLSASGSRSSWSPASASSASGRSPPPSWGNMVQVGFQYLEIAPWFALVPAAAIFVAVLGFNMLGDGLRDVLDPQSHV